MNKALSDPREDCRPTSRKTNQMTSFWRELFRIGRGANANPGVNGSKWVGNSMGGASGEAGFSRWWEPGQLGKNITSLCNILQQE